MRSNCTARPPFHAVEIRFPFSPFSPSAAPRGSVSSLLFSHHNRGSMEGLHDPRLPTWRCSTQWRLSKHPWPIRGGGSVELIPVGLSNCSHSSNKRPRWGREGRTRDRAENKKAPLVKSFLLALRNLRRIPIATRLRLNNLVRIRPLSWQLSVRHHPPPPPVELSRRSLPPPTRGSRWVHVLVRQTRGRSSSACINVKPTCARFFSGGPHAHLRFTCARRWTRRRRRPLSGAHGGGGLRKRGLGTFNNSGTLSRRWPGDAVPRTNEVVGDHYQRRTCRVGNFPNRPPPEEDPTPLAATARGTSGRPGWSDPGVSASRVLLWAKGSASSLSPPQEPTYGEYRERPVWGISLFGMHQERWLLWQMDDAICSIIIDPYTPLTLI